MDHKEELAQIVETVQKDMGQFELLYSYVINKVYCWCHNIVKDEATAKDLTQESMIRIHHKLHTLDNAKAFRSWMYVLVRNVCYSYLRSNKSEDALLLESDKYTEDFEDIIEEKRVEHLPQEAYDLKETKQLIAGFIEQLPRKQREVIRLFYLEEFTTNEIAEMLHYNIGTVRTHLHYGRRNLERLIAEYEQKNKTKLYSVILLPQLGTILQEYSKMISDKQDLSYDKSKYKPEKLPQVMNFKKAKFIHVVSAASIALIVAVIVMSVAFIQSNNSNTAVDSVSANLKSLGNDIEMFQKIEGNPYVESITYYTFPTRNSTPILINLKKDISEQKIKIVFEDEEIQFEKSNREITVMAKRNGEYIMTIDDMKTSLIADTINEHAPEVTGIQNYKNYLQMHVDDELSQINYEKSYIRFKDKEYRITRDNQVKGSFKGDVAIYIYNDMDQYIYYEINLK